MTIATRVDNPGESFDTDEEQEVDPSSLYFPTHIPEGILDRIRTEARHVKYDNTAEERATLAAVDEAVFDRVRPLEAQTIARAEQLLKDTRSDLVQDEGQRLANPLRVAEDHLTELHAIRDALREGKVPTAELAERYKNVQRAIRATAGNALLVRAQDAKGISERLSDPVAHVQKILHTMPLGNWRPLGIRHW